MKTALAIITALVIIVTSLTIRTTIAQADENQGKNVISCEDITIEGYRDGNGIIKNIGLGAKRVRIAHQTQFGEITVSMHRIVSKQVQTETMVGEYVFYIYSDSGGLLGVLKAKDLPIRVTYGL